MSLSLFLGRSLDRPVGGRPSAAGGPPGPGTSGPRVPLDFCVYCGTPLTAGATICSACGRAAVPV